MSKLRLDRLKPKLERARVKTLDQMAKAAIAHYKIEVFMQKSWDGVAWKPRVDAKAHPLLMKTKKMNKSIRELRRTTYSRVVGSDVLYAKFHNAGTPKMPKRQFIGMDRALSGKLKQVLNLFGSNVK